MMGPEESHDEDPIVDVAHAVIDRCASLGFSDQLRVLGIAWGAVAGLAREAALPYPGEFPAEKARQLALLEKRTAWVRDATPELELHRMYLEHDWEGIDAKLQQLWNRLDSATEQPE